LTKKLSVLLENDSTGGSYCWAAEISANADEYRNKMIIFTVILVKMNIIWYNLGKQESGEGQCQSWPWALPLNTRT